MVPKFKFGTNYKSEAISILIKKIFGTLDDYQILPSFKEIKNFVENAEYPIGKILIITSETLITSERLLLTLKEDLKFPTFHLIIIQTEISFDHNLFDDSSRVHLVDSTDNDMYVDLAHHLHGIKEALFHLWVEITVSYILNSYEEQYSSLVKSETQANNFISTIKQEVAAQAIQVFHLDRYENVFLPKEGFGVAPISVIPIDVAVSLFKFERDCLTYNSQSPESQQILAKFPPRQLHIIEIIVSTFLFEDEPCLIIYAFDKQNDPMFMWEICHIASREIFHLLRGNAIKSQYNTLKNLTMLQSLTGEKKNALGDALKHLQDYFNASSVSIIEILPQEIDNFKFEKTYIANSQVKHDFVPAGGFVDYCITKNKALLLTRTFRDGTPGFGIGLEFNPKNIKNSIGKKVRIPFVLSPKAVERELSLIYFPLHHDDKIIGALKVSDFEKSNSFNIRHLKSLGTFAEPIVTILYNITSISELKFRIERTQAIEAIFAQEEALLYYRETSLGIFHQVQNYVTRIGADLLDAETLSSGLGAKGVEVSKLLQQCRNFAKKSVAMIRQAQKRGRNLNPEPKDCYLVEMIVRPSLDYAYERINTKETHGENTIVIDHTLTNKDYKVHLDIDLVKESLINVLNNSIWAIKENKFSSKKRILIAVRELPEKNSVKIVIEDSGIGIKKENIPKVFDRFFTTRGEEGTGLGLYFAKQIIQQFGGNIYIHKSFYPGKGTIVEIIFPLKEKVK
ncbi:MAG: sensor histidine kinase [Acidobacteriota bacterium]